MTFDQVIIITILLSMLVAFAMDRYRVENVAMAGLAAAFLTGVVPVHLVFSGFSSAAVITVLEILLIVGVLSSSGLMDRIGERFSPTIKTERAMIASICGLGALASVFINNIGALALLIPLALSLSAKVGVAPAKVLMPLSFATLLGGMCSLTGTPANLVANEWLLKESGRGFGYFELGIVGVPLTIAGLIWMVLAAPRLFAKMAASRDQMIEGGTSDFLIECYVPAESGLIGRTLPAIEDLYRLEIHGVVRGQSHVFARRQDIVLAKDDVLLITISLFALSELESDHAIVRKSELDFDDLYVQREFVIMPDSLLLGSRVSDIAMHVDGPVEVAGLASRWNRIEGRFADLAIGMGDVVLLQGEPAALKQLAEHCSLLPLSPRRVQAKKRGLWFNIATFAIGILLTAAGILPPELAFGGVVLAMAIRGQMDLRAALHEVNWGIVILLACMIPLGQAVDSTGTATVIANSLAQWIPVGEPLAVVFTILIASVAITPFIDNVSTVAVLSPIAVGLATRTGTEIEPALMAVAIGASLDFLTPFGHHNNAIVMGAGGYRFRDFPKLGGVLTLICLGVAMVAFAVLV
jgi:di/tricarboxylate transporter